MTDRWRIPRIRDKRQAKGAESSEDSRDDQECEVPGMINDDILIYVRYLIDHGYRVDEIRAFLGLILGICRAYETQAGRLEIGVQLEKILSIIDGDLKRKKSEENLQQRAQRRTKLEARGKRK